mmetsp:Transcript_25107/g.41673  ORF Transcript_25107/g.41673 Transcript_25107/m.41673 type:complete len:90 (-) Transcript_25107:64-333(-)
MRARQDKASTTTMPRESVSSMGVKSDIEVTVQRKRVEPEKHLADESHARHGRNHAMHTRRTREGAAAIEIQLKSNKSTYQSITVETLST